MQLETDEYGYPCRNLPDGRRLTLMPLTFGRVRIGVGKQGEQWFSDVY